MEGCLIRALAFLLPSLALADSVNNEWYSTTRALSMGNTGIASADDPATAMFYNPAGLARTKRFSAELFNPQFDFGTGVLSGSVKDFAKHGSLEKTGPLLEAKPNKKSSSLGMALYPNLAAQNFNFGVLMSAQSSSYFDGDLYHYRSRYLVVPTMALSMGTLGGRFRIGAAVRAIQLSENDRSVADLAGAGYLVDASEGFGIGLDAGALFTLPWAGLPTVGVVARNVGDTTFTGSAPLSVASGNVERSEKIKGTYDAGISFSPRFGGRNVLVFSADYRDVLDRHQVDFKRRINVGLELGFSRTFYLRAGASRGYWTAGMGLSSRNGSLDLGTYAEELSAAGFREVENRRFSLRYGSKF
jgi:hypothetical protein